MDLCRERAYGELMLDSNDDDSDFRESDFVSVSGDDVDVLLHHYRIPKLRNYGLYNGSNPPIGDGDSHQVKHNNEGKIMPLTELAAQKVACHLPFGQVERFSPPVPEPMQCRIAFWSFPQDEDDIKLYTCLANGSADVFTRAEEHINLNCVCDMLQVGFHLSASIKYTEEASTYSDCFRVAITFDRRRILSCICSCSASTFWCQHAVAVCLQRIRKPHEVKLRAPVSEYIRRLKMIQLQKFAQYLVNAQPLQILPAAQEILDELLSGKDSAINQNPAAPDPTAGATINEQTTWCLDDTHLASDIRKILLKQCTAQPTVCSDVQALHITAPPAATEYSQLLRPIRGREPEGLWNLISIVAAMMKRRDSNSVLLLEILTEEVMKCDKVVSWWFETSKKSVQCGSNHHTSSRNTQDQDSQCTSQYSCSNFCDGLVHLWRLAALNPNASSAQRQRLYKQFFEWHLDILRRHSSTAGGRAPFVMRASEINSVTYFPGFRPSMEGCLIDWSSWDSKLGRFVILEKEEIKAKNPKKKKKKCKPKQVDVEPGPSNSHEASCKSEKIEKTKLVIEPIPSDFHEAPSKSEEMEETKHDLEPKLLTNGQPCKNEVSEEAEHDQPKPGPSNQCMTKRSKDLDETRSNRDLNNIDTIHHATSVKSDGNIDRQDLTDDQHRDDGDVEQRHLKELNELGEQKNLNNEISRIERDLQVYFINGVAINTPKSPIEDPLEKYITVNRKRLNDHLETLYAKAEGLYAHGYLIQARKLASEVAMLILSNPDYPSRREAFRLCPKKKKSLLGIEMSTTISESLTKISFLCNVLMDDPENRNIVFRLVLFGVEIRRAPATTKPLEVKLINQKLDLIKLLKSIALQGEELAILRERAKAIQDGIYERDALTTLIMGNYLFDALVLSNATDCSNCNSRLGTENSRHRLANQPAHDGCYLSNDVDRQPTSQLDSDNQSNANLGFHAALGAIGVRVNLNEVEHPLLCEGTRRQRGELVLSLLTHHKDDQEKLDLILSHLFDGDVVLAAPITEPSERQAKKNSDFDQPTEASAHFMFELAKTVFDKAGGNSLTAHLFRPQLVTQNGSRGVHKRLHMCTLRIALYALGLQNRVSANWVNRTYNGRASFIHEQALEIGHSAIQFLCKSWEGYLTPTEAASIADKAGCSNDLDTKRVAAELAKSCLKHAYDLDSNTVKRILTQCKEQSIDMIVEACNEVENIAKSCNEVENVANSPRVCSGVLFATALAWYGLWQDNNPVGNVRRQTRASSSSFEGGERLSNWHTATNFTQEQCEEIGEKSHPLWDQYGRVNITPTEFNPSFKHYIIAAYRVGMMALNAMKQSSHVSSKQDPRTEGEVLYVLELAKKLGNECLYDFSQSAIQNITNPRILYIISLELNKCFDEMITSSDRAKILLPLINKSLERFVEQVKEEVPKSWFIMRYNSEYMCHIQSIIDAAEELTRVAKDMIAAGYFRELLNIVDKRGRKDALSLFNIETAKYHAWLDREMGVIDGSGARGVIYSMGRIIPPNSSSFYPPQNYYPVGRMCPPRQKPACYQNACAYRCPSARRPNYRNHPSMNRNYSNRRIQSSSATSHLDFKTLPQ